MHSNEKLIRDSYDAMAKGDGSALAKLLLPETQWTIHGEGPLAGTYIGPDKIFSFWKLVAKKTGGGLRLEVIDVLANDQRAIALVMAKGNRGDHRLEERQIAEFIIKDGKILSASFVYERPAKYDAFWAE